MGSPVSVWSLPGVPMKTKPLVTIMTLCYNHEQYLDDYFRGLLSQTYRNIQLILFDDGSTDGSWEKVCHYEARLREKFPLVILERHDSIGPTEEILLALDRAEGELLCILESDDYYLPTKIEENVRYFAEHPDVGAVHGEVDYIYGKRIKYRHWTTVGKKTPSGDIFMALLVDNFIMICSFCCRTDLYRKYVNLREYVAKGYIARDYASFLDLSRHTRFGYIDKSLARYRVLQNSFAHSTDLQKAFHLEKDYQQIKLDFIEKYNGSDRARNLAIEGMYQALFLFGFRKYHADQCLGAYDWLKRHNPEGYKSVPFRLLALSVRNKLLWSLMRQLENLTIVQRTVLTLFSLRNRGQAGID